MVLEILFLFVTILLCITIAIAIKLFFDFKLGDKDDSLHSAIDVLHLLKTYKPFPVTSSQGWKLFDFKHDLRIWRKIITGSLFKKPVPLYAAFTKVKGSSVHVLGALKEILIRQEWDPFVTQIKYVSMATEREIRSQKNQPNLPVQHDVISCETNFIPSITLKIINWCSHLIQGNDLISKIHKLQRFWHREDNGCCWLLEVDEEHREWHFYLAQPVDGFFEIDQCLLTLIVFPMTTRGPAGPELPALRLACLQSFFFYRKLQCAPLHTIALPAADSFDSSEEVQTAGKNTDSPKSEQTKSLEAKPEITIIQRFKNMIEEKKNQMDEKKRKTLAQKEVSPSSILQHSPSTQLRDMADAKGYESDTESSDSDKTAFFKDKKIIDKGSILKFLRSSSFRDSKDGGDEGDGAEGKSTAVDEKVMEKESGVLSEEAKLMMRFQTLANQAAAEIIAEVVQVSNIDITKPYEEQAESTGGWVFCGMEKDVVILRKILDDNGNNRQSYLGKGLIPVSPQVVWDTIRNPRTRFTYDEMLKGTDTIHDFGNGMKIVYLFHEVSQLFRKEIRDFCVLQTERKEGDKLILSLVSVDWPGCPENANIPRAQFHPSGWIIEPAVKNKKIFSMVTYFVQMELGPNRTNTAYLIEELAAKQPMSIYFLRQYLVPSVAFSRVLNKQREQEKEEAEKDSEKEKE